MHRYFFFDEINLKSRYCHYIFAQTKACFQIKMQSKAFNGLFTVCLQNALNLIRLLLFLPWVFPKIFFIFVNGRISDHKKAKFSVLKQYYLKYEMFGQYKSILSLLLVIILNSYVPTIVLQNLSILLFLMMLETCLIFFI